MSGFVSYGFSIRRIDFVCSFFNQRLDELTSKCSSDDDSAMVEAENELFSIDRELSIAITNFQMLENNTQEYQVCSEIKRVKDRFLLTSAHCHKLMDEIYLRQLGMQVPIEPIPLCLDRECIFPSCTKVAVVMSKFCGEQHEADYHNPSSLGIREQCKDK